MSLRQRDQRHLWHPLTQHKSHPECLPIVRAEGVYLFDEKGNKYLDGISSWYTSVYGHCHPYIVEKVGRQMKELDQIVFSGFTHPPAIEMAEKLVQILPEGQEKVFFSDNGSTSVEVALKMAFQYHFNRGKKKQVVLAFEEGFHGDTFGAMSTSGLSVYNGPFQDFFLKAERIEVPNTDNLGRVLAELKERLGEEDVAAFIYEPLVQGAAAMKMHDAAHLNAILKVFEDYGVVCIADEVMTGFGKTGSHFASDFCETKPDIICLSKALTAGMLPMGLTSCTSEIYQAFYDDDIGKAFFHGHTYSANPLACTAASAGMDLLLSEEIQNNLKSIKQWHTSYAADIIANPLVKEVRQKGIILALDLSVESDRYGNLRDKMFKRFMDLGIYLRPLGNTIYVHAPYVITKDQMQEIYGAIDNVIEFVGNA